MHDVSNLGAALVEEGISLLGAGPPPVAEPVFRIGELAREFSVTFRALRFYENRGLLAPRRNGASRRYSQADRERLALILKGKKLGFTLEEIRGMVAIEPSADNGALRLTRECCISQINALERQKQGIETALAELRLVYASLDAAERARRRLGDGEGPSLYQNGAA